MVRDNYCPLARPIYFDREQDSNVTVQQIIDHNVVYECKCNEQFYLRNKALCDGEIAVLDLEKE